MLEAEKKAAGLRPFAKNPRATDSNIALHADQVGTGYEMGAAPVSGRVNMAAGPEISKDTG